MSEKIPSPETKEIQEREVIDALKAKGNEDPEAHALLLRWTEQEKRRAGSGLEDQIKVVIRQARLYREAGFVDEALDTLEDAALRAWNEQLDLLHTKILREIDNVKSTS